LHVPSLLGSGGCLGKDATLREAADSARLSDPVGVAAVTGDQASAPTGLITGPLDGYDYLTFVVVIIAVVAGFYIIIQIGGLPGKLAERRHHPHAETVKILGWAGLFTALPWIHALIWAFHDSLTIDIRKIPEREQEAIDAVATALRGEQVPHAETGAAREDAPGGAGPGGTPAPGTPPTRG
jgi:hypothetical protein